MSIIPLHLQGRFEQRWAARFGSLAIRTAPKSGRLKGSPADMRRARQKPKKSPRLETEGEREMTDENEQSTTPAPSLSSAERKALRSREAQEAISDHKNAQQAFQENRERLRKERLVREAAEGPLVAPTPELPDDTPIERVLFSTRIQNALRAADLKTVGEVREVSDETLISLPDFGKGSLSELRKKLGLPSTDGVRPVSKKPA
jgi:hypothetical protein